MLWILDEDIIESSFFLSNSWSLTSCFLSQVLHHETKTFLLWPQKTFHSFSISLFLLRRFTHISSLTLHAQLNYSKGNTDVSLLVRVLDIRKLKYHVRRKRRTKRTKGRRESEKERDEAKGWSKDGKGKWKDEGKSQTSLLREISDHFWFPSELRWCYSGEERGKVPPQIYSQPDFLDSLLVLLLVSLSLYFVETKCLNFSLTTWSLRPASSSSLSFLGRKV